MRSESAVPRLSYCEGELEIYRPSRAHELGDNLDRERPDLAIEVQWTSGGLDKLDIYARLGIPEVWIWKRGHISVHLLSSGAYVEATGSEALAGIDLDALTEQLNAPSASAAIRAFRAKLEST